MGVVAHRIWVRVAQDNEVGRCLVDEYVWRVLIRLHEGRANRFGGRTQLLELHAIEQGEILCAEHRGDGAAGDQRGADEQFTGAFGICCHGDEPPKGDRSSCWFL